MVQLVITAPARRDLKEIFKHIARESGHPSRAREYIHKLREKCNIVAKNPKAFTERTDISVGLRAFPVDNYVVLYRINGKTVVVTRIIHAAQDITRGLE